MSQLRAALGRLEAGLLAASSPVVRELRPGLPESEVDQRFHDLQLEPPDEVKAWFGWHDGYEPGPGNHSFGDIAPGTRPWSLARACDFHSLLCDNLSYVAPDQDRGWFPLGNCQDKRVLIVYCGTARPDQYGHVTVTEVELPDRRYWATTLAEPVEWWAQYLANGSYYFDPNVGIRWSLAASDVPDDRRLSGLVW